MLCIWVVATLSWVLLHKLLSFWGALRRLWSAFAIICTNLAGVNQMEVAKRNAIPTLSATIEVTLLLR